MRQGHFSMERLVAVRRADGGRFLLCEHGIAHGVRPEFLVLLDLFRRLFHVTASLMAVLRLSVCLDPELRETHGVVPNASTPECLDPFFDVLRLFHVGTSL